MLTHTALGTPDEVGEYLDGFRKLADADELIVAFQSPSVEGRLRSVVLTAEAMDVPAGLRGFATRGGPGRPTDVTYSIVARDPATGEMGVATQSQAFAVGNSVPFALPGHGVIATQSMAEPMYGSVGLDLLQGGFTAQEVLTALSSVDPHPGRRQVAVLGVNGDLAAYTGEQCVDEAGHLQGDTCVALANMAASSAVWTSMVESFEGSAGPIAQRLLTALQAGRTPAATSGAGGPRRSWSSGPPRPVAPGTTRSSTCASTTRPTRSPRSASC